MTKNAIKKLFHQVRGLIVSARHAAARSIDTLQVLTNFEIGRLIVEHEQRGGQRAKYGTQVLQNLSAALTKEFGRGFSEDNLSNMRRFYLEYRGRSRAISEKVSRKLPSSGKSPGVPGQGSLSPGQLRLLKDVFTLSWSHYVFLCRIEDVRERSFYEIEAKQGHWSVPELKRQFDSGLYERLALSKKKGDLKRLARKGQIVEKPADIIKQPYVLEFLGIDEQTTYTETDLETAIIDKLEHFLLEMGKGFLFEARQKRFTFHSDHFFVDLVFYNRLLRCYVLIDLKIGKLTHQDLGQMQMYANYFDRYVKTRQETPTIGIVLCKMRNSALVELTLPENTNVYASPYQVYLPSKKELKQKLMEWTRTE
jgi:predicted nuclease of restriction endonuclease-like (RecB) superfamily